MSMERILWFDEQLRAGRYPRSADLAAHFGISLRTAQRDIESLRDRLHAPLEFKSPKKGYAYGDAGFDLLSALDAAIRKGGGFIRSGIARNVRIRFAPDKADLISGLELHPDQRVQYELDGSAVLELPEGSIPWIIGLILLQRGRVSVIAPQDIREAVQAETERLAAAYPERKR